MAHGSSYPKIQLWPMYVLFVLALCIGVIALFSPAAFGGTVPTKAILEVALVVIVLTALLIGVPHIVIWFRVSDLHQMTMQLQTTAARIDQIREILRDPATGGNRLDGIASDLDLKARLDAIEKRVVALGGVQATLNQILAQFNEGGYARQKLDATAAQFNDQGYARQKLDAIAAQLSDGGYTRQKLDAIAAQFNDGGYARQKLDAIDSKIKTT
jgi:hypothetical protein